MDYVWFGLGLLALTGLTVVLGRWGGVGVGFFPAWAMTRAVVQLSIVALVQLSIVALLLRGILAAPWTVVAFLVLMLTTVSWTAAGVVIGNCMSAATLAGRNFLRASRERRGEIEAMLALGASPQLAHEEIGQEAVREALLPNLDEAKSTGLVTLPGAFVGALFGGASPVVAAQFQLVVLAGIGLAMMTTAIVVTQLAGRAPYTPVAGGAPG